MIENMGLLAPPQFKFNNKQYAGALFPDKIHVLPSEKIAGVDFKRAVPVDTIVPYGIGFGRDSRQSGRRVCSG
jgi:hypothetical protein